MRSTFYDTILDAEPELRCHCGHQYKEKVHSTTLNMIIIFVVCRTFPVGDHIRT
jgi:hypothetical protein